MYRSSRITIQNFQIRLLYFTIAAIGKQFLYNQHIYLNTTWNLENLYRGDARVLKLPEKHP